MASTNQPSLGSILGSTLMSSIGGGIIPAALSFGSSLLEHKWNQQAAADERAWQEKMIDKQNAYNDPSAQLQRLRDAGINPTLAGQNIDPGSSASPVGSTLLGSSVSDVSGAFNNGASNMNEAVNFEKNLAQLRKYQDAVIKNEDKKTDSQVSLQQKQKEIADTQVLLNLGQIATNDVERFMTRVKASYFSLNAKLDLDEKAARLSLTRAEAQNALSEALYKALMIQYQPILVQNF